MGTRDAKCEASTSALPYTPPASISLPNELLDVIFDLARPPLPPTTTRKEPLSNAWIAYAQLPLVHSRWTEVARKHLAKVVILRSRRQMRSLARALREGWVAKVEEILLEMKETRSGHEGEGAIGEDSLVCAAGNPSFEAELLKLLERCGQNVKVLRSRGFGDACLAYLPTSFREHLPKLETFEYSPIDGAHPATTTGLMCGLSGLPSLRHLVLRPSSRYLTPLASVPEPFVTALTALVDVLPSMLASDTNMREAYTSAFTDVGMQGLTSAELSSLVMTPLALVGILFPSFCTITSLHLASILVVGASSTLNLLLQIIAPNLDDFEWTDGPISSQLNLNLGALPDKDYWDVLRKLTKVRKLKLFGSQIFAPTPHRLGFALPPSLEELTIGTCGEDVEREEVEWWLDRVEDGEKAGEKGHEEEHAEEHEDEEEEDVEDANDAGIGLVLDDEEEEDEIGAAKKKAGKGEACEEDEGDGNNGSADDSRPSSPALPPSPNPPSILAPAPSPSPPLSRSATASPAARPSSPSTAPQRPHLSPRRRRQSWRTPPTPASPPRLSRLAICLPTVSNSSLRDNSDIQDRVDALVERGIRVEWWGLVVVVIETEELTRELREEMSRVPKEWYAGAWDGLSVEEEEEEEEEE
ncbi:hypothetical protein Rt10032_c03g1605 [Rhodotorula toruloides]|uniref:Uncharacterized protein n=1 Tax=Rhodotorula toruloides TaxID=5286 RepID=A0A511KB24_RHOTO|nr:hypothetical protein Rt10032_c03g1605 [Rhodotorula toruloides]